VLEFPPTEIETSDALIGRDLVDLEWISTALETPPTEIETENTARGR